jgi:hypothetical protein
MKSTDGLCTILIAPKPKWRNGRRAGLKIQYTQVCVGSTPTSGTSYAVTIYIKIVAVFLLKMIRPPMTCDE